MNLQTLYGLWDELSKIDVDSNGQILSNFLQFQTGTPSSDVYVWFGSQNPAFDLIAVQAGRRQPIDMFAVVTVEESDELTAPSIHGARHSREDAFSLAWRVAMAMKKTVDEELATGNGEDCCQVAVRRTESGFALMATPYRAYARVDVVPTRATHGVGETCYPPQDHAEPVALVA
jgi:hypothetical protein